MRAGAPEAPPAPVKTTESAQRTARGMTILFLTRDSIWQCHGDHVAVMLRKAGHRIEFMPFDPKARADCGVQAWADKNGGYPDATMSWEEHGRKFWTVRMREYVAWAIAKGIAPLHIDLSNFDHKKAYILDQYTPEAPGLIDEDWDALSDATPTPAELGPRFTAYANAFRARLADAANEPPLRPPGYVLFWTQGDTWMSRIPGDWHQIIGGIQSRLAARSLRLVVKTGRLARPRSLFPANCDLIENDAKVPLQNERLIRHAAWHILLTSSVSNELVLAGAPVLALGASRFSGHDVFAEAHDWHDINTMLPAVNPAARNRWIRWWAANNSYSDQIADRTVALIARFRANRKAPTSSAPPMSAPAVTTITTVFVNDQRSETVTRECLHAVVREYPRAQRIAAVDLAPRAFIEELRRLAFEVVELSTGAPPRMNTLLKEAVRRARAPLVMVIESDVIIEVGFAEKMSRTAAAFDTDPHVQAIEAVTVSADGRVNWPSIGRFPPKNTPAPHPASGLERDVFYPTFCATLYRRAALASVDWDKAPTMGWCDKMIWKQIAASGGISLLAPDIKARHYISVARTAAQQNSLNEGAAHMHPSSFREMGRAIQKYLGPRRGEKLEILDVGSMSVNANYPHTYRELMSPNWVYTGCDIAPGKNVDLVQLAPYRIREEDGLYDAVISGQCLEHVQAPWMLVREMARMLKPGGLLLITAPWNFPIHRYPLDCWRILPDGMNSLMADAGLEAVAAHVIESDCWGIGKKGSAA
jgi:hypothetical protein